VSGEREIELVVNCHRSSRFREPERFPAGAFPNPQRRARAAAPMTAIGRAEVRSSDFRGIPTGRASLRGTKVLVNMVLMVSRPVGGVLSSASRRLGGHPSERSTRGLPRPKPMRTGSPCPLRDLAPGGVCLAIPVTRDAGALLPHRFTLACAGANPGHRRSVLCGTFRQVALPGCWPAPCPVEPRPSSTRSLPRRGHPADSPSTSQVSRAPAEPTTMACAGSVRDGQRSTHGVGMDAAVVVVLAGVSRRELVGVAGLQER